MAVTLTRYGDTYRLPFRSLYEEAFPPAERKDFDYLLTQQADGLYDLWAVTDDSDHFVGLVTAVRYQEYVLLDYLAVCPAHRGRGIGHHILAAVRRQYAHLHLFLEIEVPCDTADNARQRERRLAFYQDAGLIRTGVRARIYGDLMELLAYPEDAPHITFDLYRDMLEATFPPHMIPEKP